MAQNFWSLLPKALETQIKSKTPILRLKRGDSIYKAGDTPKGLYIIEEGLVGLVLIGAQSGKEHFLRFFTSGQYFGHRALFSSETYHANSTVLENTKLYFLPKDLVNNILLEEPSLYRAVAMVLAQELRRAEEQHIMILENQVLCRTAQSLVYLKELHPEHNWTRQEIANFTASTVSTIIKALARLQEMGLISQDGRSINVLKRDDLIHLQSNEII